ncbi:hypothetical protein DBV15_08726 [Temnothorax longispinosus]|uniref:Uncharacterized protein n=1 Tax=Temnothorax longispinosus TaxID=300112 RepID=A0A4S2KQD4_9HYME|nr:hypothetical protein DBV15_08726 [Temnothorax longispinosus]
MPYGDIREPHDRSGSLTHDVFSQRGIRSSRISPEGTSRTAESRLIPDRRAAVSARPIDRAGRSIDRSVGRRGRRTGGWGPRSQAVILRAMPKREERGMRNSHPRGCGARARESGRKRNIKPVVWKTAGTYNELHEILELAIFVQFRACESLDVARRPVDDPGLEETGRRESRGERRTVEEKEPGETRRRSRDARRWPVVTSSSTRRGERKRERERDRVIESKRERSLLSRETGSHPSRRLRRLLLHLGDIALSVLRGAPDTTLHFLTANLALKTLRCRNRFPARREVTRVTVSRVKARPKDGKLRDDEIPDGDASRAASISGFRSSKPPPTCGSSNFVPQFTSDNIVLNMSSQIRSIDWRKPTPPLTGTAARSGRCIGITRRSHSSARRRGNARCPTTIVLRLKHQKFLARRESIDCRLIRPAIVINLADNGYTTVSNAIARPGHEAPRAATIADRDKKELCGSKKEREKGAMWERRGGIYALPFAPLRSSRLPYAERKPCRAVPVPWLRRTLCVASASVPARFIVASRRCIALAVERDASEGADTFWLFRRKFGNALVPDRRELSCTTRYTEVSVSVDIINSTAYPGIPRVLVLIPRIINAG